MKKVHSEESFFSVNWLPQNFELVSKVGRGNSLIPIFVTFGAKLNVNYLEFCMKYVFLNELMFNFDLEVVDVIYNWVSVDEDKRRGNISNKLNFWNIFLFKILSPCTIF